MKCNGYLCIRRPILRTTPVEYQLRNWLYSQVTVSKIPNTVKQTLTPLVPHSAVNFTDEKRWPIKLCNLCQRIVLKDGKWLLSLKLGRKNTQECKATNFRFNIWIVRKRLLVRRFLPAGTVRIVGFVSGRAADSAFFWGAVPPSLRVCGICHLD